VLRQLTYHLFPYTTLFRSRMQAFESLKERLESAPAVVDRAPFVGRDDLLNEMLTRLHRGQSKGLRVVLIEGPPGIGKSRFIEELQIRSSLEGLTFLKSSCSGDSDGLS